MISKRRYGNWKVYAFVRMPFFAIYRPQVKSFRNIRSRTKEPVLIIRPKIGKGTSKDGLLALVMQFLGWMRYAERRGLVPIVDLQYCRNMYLRSEEFGIFNPWTDFFEQPEGWSLSRGLAAEKGYVTRVRLRGDDYPQTTMDVFEDRSGKLTDWRAVVGRWLHPSANIRRRVEEFLVVSGLNMSKTVGVLARGTDYFALRPAGHPVQPTMEQIVDDVREMLARGYDRVFLVTEDQSNRDALMRAFGTQLVLAPQSCVAYRGGYLADSDAVSGNRRMAADYLVSILILSKCGAIVAGRTSGSLGAALFSKGFSHQKFYDLGIYE